MRSDARSCSYFDNDADFDERHEMYADDAVLEFPQSGERFVGKQNFMTWRKAYPANVTYRIRRITGSGDLWVTEILVSYDGSAPMFGLDILRFRDGKVVLRIHLRDGGVRGRRRGAPNGRRRSIRWRRSHPQDWHDGIAVRTRA